MSKKANKDARVRELLIENERLKKINSELYAELLSLKKHSEQKNSSHRLLLGDIAMKAQLSKKKSFLSYLFGSFKLKSVYSLYRRLVFVVRKYTFVTTTLKILTFILGIIQSGAIIILFTGTLTVLLPVTLIFSYSAAVFTLIFSKSLTKRVKSMMNGRKITVFFPTSRKAFEKDSYFRKMVRDVSADEKSLSVIVSPYAVSPIGISNKKGFYLAMRRESERIIIIRTHYFFIFKKRALLPHSKDVTLVY